MSVSPGSAVYPAPTPDGAALCLACGLCCDGTLHTFTKVLPGEVEAMQRLGLKVYSAANGPAFDQPCPCLQAGSCTIYAHRPLSCRSYECKLFKKYAAGMVTLEEALGRVQKAKELIVAARLQPEDTRQAAALRAYLQRHFEPAQALHEGLRP